MSVWDTKEGQQALRDRVMDRAFMQDDWEPQPADDDVHATAARPDDPERCDRIVNNGMGEPTECGRTLPCVYHDPDACDACGYMFEIHDTKRLPPNGVASPFGCPWSEQEAIERWGQR